MKKRLQVVGIMSGTSLDGVDYVLCHITPTSMKFLDQAHFRFPLSLRNKLFKAVSHKMPVDQLAELDFELGQFYARKLCQKKHWKIDLIGLHGQTVYHRGGVASLQIGQPSFLAAQMGLPVVSNFRSMDIARGGQGAPLATLFHKKILAVKAQQWVLKKSRNPSAIAIQNIGGIANVTFIGKKVMTYDIGPGNVLMNSLMEKLTKGRSHYDHQGHLAFQGIPNTSIVKKWMKDFYFIKKPPKSFDRKTYAGPFFQKCLKDLKGLLPQDQMATLADLTAQLIITSYKTHLPCTPTVVVLCGGGALNRYVVHRIRYLAADFADPPHIITSKDLRWPLQAVEGGAFALLAAYRYWNKPVGVFKKVILGDITEG